MKYSFIFVLILCLSVLSDSAKAMVFMAPEASRADYERYLLRTKQESYTEWVSKTGYATKRSEATRPAEISSPAKPSTSAELSARVLEFVEATLSKGFANEKERQLAWEKIRTEHVLIPEEREYLLLLAEKEGNTLEVCRALSLEPALQKKLEFPERSWNCQKLQVTVSSALTKDLENGDLLSIDGKLFSRESVPRALVPGTYKWKVYSNRYVDEEFVTSLEGIANHSFAKQPWVDGTCLAANVRHPEFSVVSQASSYFTDDCVPSAAPLMAEPKSWYAENKRLVWGLGLLLAGAAAYSLRDKDLILTKP